MYHYEGLDILLFLIYITILNFKNMEKDDGSTVLTDVDLLAGEGGAEALKKPRLRLETHLKTNLPRTNNPRPFIERWQSPEYGDFFITVEPDKKCVEVYDADGNLCENFGVTGSQMRPVLGAMVNKNVDNGMGRLKYGSLASLQVDPVSKYMMSTSFNTIWGRGGGRSGDCISIDQLPAELQHIIDKTPHYNELKNLSSNNGLPLEHSNYSKGFSLEQVRSFCVDGSRYIVLIDYGTKSYLVFDTYAGTQSGVLPRNWKRYEKFQPQIVSIKEKIEENVECRGKKRFEFMVNGRQVKCKHQVAAGDGIFLDTVKVDDIKGVGDNLCVENKDDGAVLYYCVSNDPREIWAVEVGSSSDGGQALFYPPKSRKLPQKYGSVSSLRLDPGGNFLIFKSEQRQRGKWIVIEKETMEEVEGFLQNIGDFSFDGDGRVKTRDDKDQLVLYDTNFAELGEDIRRWRLATKAKDISAADIFGGGRKEENEKIDLRLAVLDPLKKKYEDMFTPRLAAAHQAQGAEEIDKLMAPLNELERQLRSMGLTEAEVAYITGDIKIQIDYWRGQYIKNEIDVLSAGFRERLEGLDVFTLDQTEQVLDEIGAAIKRGTDYGYSDPDLAGMRDRLDIYLKRQWQENRDECMAQTGEQVQEVIQGISEVEDIDSLRGFKEANHVYRSLMDRLERYRRLIGSEEISAIKARVNEEFESRKALLRRDQEELKEAKERERQAHLKEIENEIAAMDADIQETVGQPLQMERFMAASDELRRVRITIENMVEEEDRKRMVMILDRMLGKHSMRLQNAGTLRTTKDGGHVIFGAEKFPRFTGRAEKKTVTWEIGFDVNRDPANENKDQLVFYFESSEGEKKYLSEMLSEIKGVVGGAKVPTSLCRRDYVFCADEPDFYLNVIRAHLEEQNKVSNTGSRVPGVPQELVYSEEVIESLEQMAKLSKMQLGMDYEGVQSKGPQGMLLLEGDTGTGKDILIDIFASQTRRPLYVFDCSKWTQKGELTYTYEFDGRTVRVDSEVQKALQTPGAILYFNEFNQLSEAAQKYLNSLLSHRRQIKGAFNGNRKTEEDVLIFGSMNGRKGYYGVDIEASSVSRIRYLEVDYMQEKTDVYACTDEVIANGRRLTALKDLADGDFRLLFDYVVNGDVKDDQRSGVAALATPERISAMSLLKTTLKAQNKLAVRETRWNHSEAFAMAKLSPEFGKMNEDDFRKFWDYVINGKTGNGGRDLLTQERGKMLVAFKLVVQAANDIRRQFRKTHSGEDVNEGEEVKFIASLRETVECAKEIDYYHEMFESGEDLALYAMRSVMLPKIPRPAERTYMENLFSQGVKVGAPSARKP